MATSASARVGASMIACRDRALGAVGTGTASGNSRGASCIAFEVRNGLSGQDVPGTCLCRCRPQPARSGNGVSYKQDFEVLEAGAVKVSYDRKTEAVSRILLKSS